ncbi:MAG: hypothetical protein V1799_08615 [bacterium]
MQNEKVIRPSIGAYVRRSSVFVIAFSLLLSVYSISLNAPWELLIFVAIFGIILLSYIFNMIATSISITFAGIIYKPGLWGRKSLSWSDISEVTTGVRINFSTSDEYPSTYKYLTILRSNTSPNKDIEIDIKLFSKCDRIDVCSTLLEAVWNELSGRIRLVQTPIKPEGGMIDDTTQARAIGRVASASNSIWLAVFMGAMAGVAIGKLTDPATGIATTIGVVIIISAIVKKLNS